MLDEIRKALPRLENWDRIYPTNTMRCLVVNIYVNITKFSARAAEYFARFRSECIPTFDQTLNRDIERKNREA